MQRTTHLSAPPFNGRVVEAAEGLDLRPLLAVDDVAGLLGIPRPPCTGGTRGLRPTLHRGHGRFG